MARLYTVLDPGIILGLGINGPLTEPTPIPLSYVNAMVRKGRIVYQHNPTDYNDKVLVTNTNASIITFVPKVKKTATSKDSDCMEHVEKVNNQYVSNQEYRNNKNKKHKHNHHGSEKKEDIQIKDIVTEEPVKVGDAFENTNIQV